MLFRSGYINQVSQVEKASEAKDLVLLDADLAYTTGNVYLSYKGGTLYVTTSTKEGFYVSPDVQVALALASKPDSTNDNLANAFDSVDTYTGRDGLVKALRNLDTEGKDIDGDGIVEYLFNGNLAAVIEDGVATSIVLDDRSGTLSPNYNPLEAMKVTVNMVDIDTNRTLDSKEVSIYKDTVFTASDYITSLNERWEANYKAVPSGDTETVSYREGAEKTITFYYRDEEDAGTMTVIVNFVDANDKIIDSLAPAEKAADDGHNYITMAPAAYKDALAELTDGAYEMNTTRTQYINFVKGGIAEVNFEVKQVKFDVSVTAGTGFTGWSVKESTTDPIGAGDTIKVVMQKDTAEVYGETYFNTLTFGTDSVTNGKLGEVIAILSEEGTADTKAEITLTIPVTEITGDLSFNVTATAN